MKRRLWRLVALSGALALPLFAEAQSSPEGDPLVTLQLKAAPTRAQSTIRFEGKTILPSGALVKGRLFRLEERLASGRLSAEPVEVGQTLSQAAERRLSFEFPSDRPGRYRLALELSEDRQDPALAASLRKLPTTKWTFEARAWGEEWTHQAELKLCDLDRVGQEAIALVEAVAQAASSKESWTAQRAKYEKDLEAFLRKLDESRLEHFYPAVMKEIRDTLRNLKGNGALFQFGEDGKFKGTIHYMTKKPTKTIHGEEFAFEKVKKDLTEALPAAGGEFCLWLIEDFRRTGERRPSALGALRAHKTHPGVATRANALEKTPLGELEDLEKSIRARPNE